MYNRYSLVDHTGLVGSISIVGAQEKWKKDSRFIFVPEICIAGRKDHIKVHLKDIGWNESKIEDSLDFFYFDTSNPYNAEMLGFGIMSRGTQNKHPDIRQIMLKAGCSPRRTLSKYKDPTHNRTTCILDMKEILSEEIRQVKEGQILFSELAAITSISTTATPLQSPASEAPPSDFMDTELLSVLRKRSKRPRLRWGCAVDTPKVVETQLSVEESSRRRMRNAKRTTRFGRLVFLTY